MTDITTQLVLVALDFTAYRLAEEPDAPLGEALGGAIRQAKISDPTGAIHATALAALQAAPADPPNRAVGAALAVRTAERNRTHPRVKHRTTGRTGRVCNLGGIAGSWVEVAWDDTGLASPERLTSLAVLSG
jgi:hypothetical protein